MMMCFVIFSRDKRTPPAAAPDLLAISQSESPERAGITEELRGIGCWTVTYKMWFTRDWNYIVKKKTPRKYSVVNKRNGFRWNGFRRNGRKTRENIRFKFKRFKSKWLIIYVRNGFRWKIFGSNSKVLISNGQHYMFGIDSVGKYSVQIQKCWFQMVNIIWSE